MSEFTGIPRMRHAIVTRPGEPRRVQDRARRIRIGTTIAGCAVAAVLLARLAAHADAAATWAAVRSAGPLVLTAVVPFGIGMSIDAYGLLLLVRALGHRTTFLQMLPVRVATEALHITMPGGVVASDTATAMLLEARCEVPVRDGVVASLARRWLVMRAHTGYIALGAAAGFSALAAVSRTLMHSSALPWMVIASSAIPLVLSGAIGAGLLGRSTFARLHRALERVPSRRLARWLEARRHEAVATDGQVQRLRASHRAMNGATLCFLVCWCFEALESALLLHLVGVPIDLAAVFAIEAGLSLVRSAAVIAPSGLGVVDLGYATVLPVLGAEGGAAAAFVLLKRAKEAAWVLLGYALLVRRARMAGRGPLAEWQTQSI